MIVAHWRESSWRSLQPPPAKKVEGVSFQCDVNTKHQQNKKMWCEQVQGVEGRTQRSQYENSRKWSECENEIKGSSWEWVSSSLKQAIPWQREGVLRNKQYGNRFVFATNEREPVPSFNELRFCFCAQKVSRPISTVEGSSPLCWKSVFSISLKGGTLDAKWEMNERLWSCKKFADEISLGSGTTLGPLFFDGTLKRLGLNFWRINFSTHL